MLALAVAAAFLRRQRTAAHPMVDLALFRAPGFGAALGTNLVAMFLMVGFAIFTTQYLQPVLGMSPLQAALWSLVPSACVGCAAPAGVRLARYVLRPYVVSAGFAVAAVGFLVLTLLRADSPLPLVLAGAAAQAGAVSGLLESGTEFGGALGMAVLGGVGAAVHRPGSADAVPDALSCGAPGGSTGGPPGATAYELPPGAADMAREPLGGAGAVADRLPEPAGDTLLTAARAAFTDGTNAAAVAAAVLATAAALADPRAYGGGPRRPPGQR
ncbi:hypothetical protein ABXR15_10120 [Streptomyces phytohabitans]